MHEDHERITALVAEVEELRSAANDAKTLQETLTTAEQEIASLNSQIAELKSGQDDASADKSPVLALEEQVSLLNEIIRQKDDAIEALRSENEGSAAATPRFSTESLQDEKLSVATEKIAELQDELAAKEAALASQISESASIALSQEPAERILSVTAESGALGVKFNQSHGDDDTGPYVTVDSVRPNGPAERCGMQPGDIVLCVEDDDSDAVCTVPTLMELMQAYCKDDQAFELTVSQMSSNARVMLAKRHATNAA